MTANTPPLTIVVLGASGDLARRKIFPALFALYCQKLLPERFHIFGYARSVFTQEAFRTHIMEKLTCRYTPGESCADRMDEFLARCHYAQGGYDDVPAYAELDRQMKKAEGAPANRIFYLAIPPSVFLDVARAMGTSGLAGSQAESPWTRVVVEKPFGHDRASSDELAEGLAEVFPESVTYRIDHYLGKEVIQNLLVLRFANLVFEPIWNRERIQNVSIAWKEKIGVEGRGGYFDSYGVVRDVMQNHLLQILALVAMEQPAALTATRIRDEKVKLLSRVSPLNRSSMVLGQYTGTTVGSRQQPDYRQEAHVLTDSRTPTFGAALLTIDNYRWEGVPFYMLAGKGLETSLTEIRIAFRDVPGNIFRGVPGFRGGNTLVIRVQPNEAINLHIVNKVPGLGMALAETDLDLSYHSAFANQIPDAYECLLLDVINGDRSLFIRRDELDAAWDIFTPALHEADRLRIEPEPYVFGTPGPSSAADLARRHGVVL